MRALELAARAPTRVNSLHDTTGSEPLEMPFVASLRYMAAYSGPNRPPIPGQIVHPFRLNSSTDSGAIRPLIPAQIVHRFRSNSSGAAASVRS